MLQSDLDSSSAIRDRAATNRTRVTQANHEISNANSNAPSKAPNENLPQRSGKALANDKQQNLFIQPRTSRQAISGVHRREHGRNTPIHHTTMVDIKEHDNAHSQHPQRESKRSARKPHQRKQHSKCPPYLH